MLKTLRYTFFLALLALSFPSFAEEADSSPVQAELISEQENIRLGAPFYVAIRLRVEEGWHTYWKNPGEIGMPISVEWQLPSGFTADSLKWPVPKRYDDASRIGYGYDGEVVLLAKITPPESGHPYPEAQIKADVSWLACSESACLPDEAELEISLPIGFKEARPHPEHSSLIAAARAKLPEESWGNLTATRTQNLVELNFALPKGVPSPTKGSFYPEMPETIDEKAATPLAIGAEPEEGRILALTEQTPSENLKGILLLEDDNSIIAAVDIDLPIISKDAGEKMIAMADPLTEAESAPLVEVPLDGGILLYILMAFAGGIILNLMPCVLPVVSFKILSFVKMAGQERKKTLQHGLAFSAGVIASFWALASALLLLQAYGRAVGWGFQLQEPIFVASLAAVILIFSLSLFGIFEVGTLFASWAGQKQHKSGGEGRGHLTGSFLSGVLATAVATPCTGPFLGSAVGFAVTQPALWALLIFTALGLGMALPYLLLSAFPNLLRFMPKPGPWMSTFKEATGFLMLATVLWLLWVFSAQTNSLALFLLLGGFFLFAFGCWIWGKWGTPLKKRSTRLVAASAAALSLLAGAKVVYTASSPAITTLEESRPISLGDHHPTGNWESFSRERVEALLQEGKPVFVDFTARWCLICQANHLVLSVDEVDKKMSDLGVVKMKGDWTKRDPAITEALARQGRSGVPLYLLYTGKPGEPPHILPQVLTPDIVLGYLNQLEEKNIAQND